MDVHKIAVIQASMGGIDPQVKHVEQSIPYDHYLFTDQNFPPRDKSMTPRLQAKLPKMFGWQMVPKHEYYMWLDGNISLNNPDTLKYFYDQIQGHDIVVIKHHGRPNIRQEVRYTRKGINQQSIYIVSRYTNELLKEQYKEIQADKDYVDDLLVIGGIFMYRNTPEVQAMFREWWHNVTRYIIQDQISFPYALKKSGVKMKILEHEYDNWELIKHVNHVKRNV